MNQPEIDPDALFVALALVPASFSRNKFFSLYSNVALFQARRRAHLVRQIISELVAGLTFRSSPGVNEGRVEVLEEEESGNGLRLVYRKSEFDYRRTAYLSPIEAAVLRYALGRAGVKPKCAEAEQKVNDVLSRFERTLEMTTEKH
jgi:hypothetical protein